MSHGTLVVVPLLLRTSDYWNSTPWTAYIGTIDGSRIEVLVIRKIEFLPSHPANQFNSMPIRLV